MLNIMEIAVKEKFISTGPRHFNDYVNLLPGQYTRLLFT